MKKISEITIVLWLILSLFSVLVIVNIPEVEAELNAPSWNPNGYWETPNGDWTIELNEDKLYENKKIVVNGDLIIEDDGKLTLSNVTLQMNKTTPNDAGWNITVDGEFNVINGSTITTDPITPAQRPDPYEFIIDGTALIENSTVEKMRDDPLSDVDGIQIYSENVEINNSTIQLNSGNGVYVENGIVTITNSSIINNNWNGVHLYSSSNNNIINNDILNNRYGIELISSSYNNINNNVVLNNYHGIYLDSSSNNNISKNNVSSNGQNGITLGWSSSNNKIIANNVYSNNHHGIVLYLSSNNIVIGNNASSNTNDGIRVSTSSNSNMITGNIVSLNSWGIQLYGVFGACSYNQITNCTVYTNDNYGIRLENSSYNKITNNNVSDNYRDIYLSTSSDNTIIGNNISLSNTDGIYLSSSNNNKIGMNSVEANSAGIRLISSSNSNLITSNYVSNNTYYALYISSCSNNKIIDNNLQNSRYGADLTSSNNNILYHNNLKNNALSNASDDGINDWDNGLEGNWWGDMGDYTDSDGNGICDSNYTGTNFVDNLPLANEDNDRVLVDDPWFWFIQSGVNFAEAGWTVYALSSTYLENVTINKTLTVIGEDRNTTIVNARGNESVVLVDHTSYVNVSGFTVMNGTKGLYLNNSDYCVIDNNIITSNTYGVNLTKSSDNTIGNNSILDNGFGIYLIESNNTHIRNNDILYSTTAGYYVSLSYDIIMEYNTIINNHVGGRLYNSSFLIQYNNISSNDYGIADVEYSFGNICNNTISYNFDSGITHAVNSNVTINNNTISYNYYGISCMYDSYATITYNNITFNTIGINCTTGSNATVHWNNIHNNTVWNITNWDNTIWINATDNYWGSDNPIEIANGINGQVIYQPYETEEIEEAGPG